MLEKRTFEVTGEHLAEYFRFAMATDLEKLAAGLRGDAELENYRWRAVGHGARRLENILCGSRNPFVVSWAQRRSAAWKIARDALGDGWELNIVQDVDFADLGAAIEVLATRPVEETATETDEGATRVADSFANEARLTREQILEKAEAEAVRAVRENLALSEEEWLGYMQMRWSDDRLIVARLATDALYNAAMSVREEWYAVRGEQDG